MYKYGRARIRKEVLFSKYISQKDSLEGISRFLKTRIIKFLLQNILHLFNKKNILLFTNSRTHGSSLGPYDKDVWSSRIYYVYSLRLSWCTYTESFYVNPTWNEWTWEWEYVKSYFVRYAFTDILRIPISVGASSQCYWDELMLLQC